MRAFVMAFATLLVIGGTAAAEPPKTAPVKRPHPTQPTIRPAQIVLASAEAAHLPAPDSGQAVQSAPKRRVAPRVTTCRCGDPQADTETQEQ